MLTFFLKKSLIYTQYQRGQYPFKFFPGEQLFHQLTPIVNTENAKKSWKSFVQLKR